MNKTLKYALLATLALGLVALAACGDDDNNDGGTTPPPVDAWVGTWISAGDDVAPVLVTYYQYDSVYVEFKEDQTVVLQSHVANGAWTTQNGTYVVTESANGDIDAIAVDYPGLQQEGIIQVFPASPDSMWLEVVALGYGLTVPTVENGFSVQDTTSNRNIQVYRRVSN